MVVFQIKTSDTDSFLYEASCDTSNDVVIRDIVRIWNMRIRLGQLSLAIRDLARYGPMKPPDKAGLDRIEEEYNGGKIEKNEFYEADPTGLRTGCGVGPHLSNILDRVAQDAEAAIDKVSHNSYL